VAEKRILLNHDMSVRHMSQPRENPAGEIEVLELWTIVLQDSVSGSTTEISFGKDTRNELINRLTGGIVLAGGELPNVGPQG